MIPPRSSIPMAMRTPPLSIIAARGHYFRPPPVVVVRRRRRGCHFFSSTTSSTTVNEIRNNSNIPISMSSARTLEEVLASIEEQTLADDELRASMKPTPWFNLLHYPSGAAWRSSDKILGGGGGSISGSLRLSSEVDDDDDDDDRDENSAAGEIDGAKMLPKTKKRNNGDGGISVLSQTQFNLLHRSERTNKQLRRTYRNILDVQMALSKKRERERRLAANSVPSNNVVSGAGDDDDYYKHGNNEKQRLKQQSIEDERGRQVGDWREKSGMHNTSSSRLDSDSGNANASSHIPPPPSYCEDPSVALSLSIGLYSSTAAGAKEKKRILNNILNNNGNIHDDSNSSNNNNNTEGENKSDGGSGSLVAATDYYYVENEAARMAASSSIKSARVANRLAKSGLGLASSTDFASKKPVAYGPEQTMTNLKYRFGPNHSIVRRVLSEVQSLLGGHGGGSGKSKGRILFQPRRVLDFGSGVGSSGAAALDVFGVGRSSNAPSSNHDAGGIDWIHSIDASQCMRETTEKVLKSILEGSPWIDEKSSNTANLNRLEEEEALLLAEYERMLFNDDGDSTNRERKRIERRRKMMERWDQSWERRTDARTRLTFGESIVDSSTTVSTSSRPTGRNSRGAYGSDRETDDESNHRRLPWQDKLDEQRRRVTERKYDSQQDQQKNKGSFDLILCSYTLTELPSVPASLAAATLLWEKLAPNGVLVIVEPGTPDGFGMLRSVRSMLLECCPPPEIRMKRKKMKVEPITSIDEKEGIDTYTLNGLLTKKDSNEDDDTWPEECHVIAPCTHNGTCPMSRHQKNHIKRNTRFSRYESAEPKDQDSDDEVRDDARKTDGDDDDEEMSFRELLDEWDNMPEGQKDELKMMLGGGDDMSDDEAKAMLEYMESMDSDEEEEDDEGEDDDSDSDHDSDSLETDGVDYEQDYYNIDEGSSKNDEPSSNKEKNPSTMAKTDVFGSSFCSFVHTFPGGTTRRKGEKFAYLVVQKRVPVLDESLNSNKNSNKHCPTTVPTENLESLNEVDIVEMLSKSVHHAQKLKREELTYRLRQRGHGGGNDDNVDVTNNIELDESPTYSYHMNQSNTLLQRAVDVEDRFLESTIDKLGLELLHGDDRRRSWGRLIRAPLKKKGHVLIDYCSAGCGGGCSVSTTDDDNGGTHGRITRQKVSRGWSARAAPGCYSAARKARWGGLWPDMSERIKRIDIDKEVELEKRIKSQRM